MQDTLLNRNPLPAARNGTSSLSERVRSLRLPDRRDGGRTGAGWLPWALCALFGVAAVFFAVREPAPAQSSSAQVASELEKLTVTLPSADSAARQPAPGEIVLEAKGYIIPVHQIQVSPKVAGMVEELYIVEGRRVKEGEVLARLEKLEYLADYKRACAVVEASWHRWLELAIGYRPEEVAQTKAELDEADARREELFLDYKRSSNLKNTPAQTAREFEQADSAYRSQERRVERLKLAFKLMQDGPRVERIDAAWAEVEQAEADRLKARWRLDNCTIVAPVSGTILTKKAEKGNIVNPVAFNISASLCEMADLSDMEVDLAVPERDIGKIFEKQKCRIRAEAFSERIYEGHVSRKMPTADRAKGAVPVRVKIVIPREEEGEYLRPEMGAVVTFLGARVN